MVSIAVARAIVWPLTRFYFRMSCEGAANVPRTGGVILCPNHSSFLDPPALQWAVSRPVRFLMDAGFYRLPHLHLFARLFRAIPVEENRRNIASLSLAERILLAGEALGVFPEGEIPTRGRLGRFRSGGAVLAMHTGAPLIPAWIEGTGESLPRSGKWPKPRPIRVRFGPPIVPRRVGRGELDRDDVEEMTAALRLAVIALAPSPGGLLDD